MYIFLLRVAINYNKADKPREREKICIILLFSNFLTPNLHN